jgi:hypothetical protein
MNQTIFTVEEENFICIFDVSSRTALINEIRAAMPDFDEPELTEIAENTLEILDGMTDAEFSELSFNPAYYNDEDETEV